VVAQCAQFETILPLALKRDRPLAWGEKGNTLVGYALSGTVPTSYIPFRYHPLVGSGGKARWREIVLCQNTGLRGRLGLLDPSAGQAWAAEYNLRI